MKIRIATALAALALAAAPAQAVITSITLSGGTAFTNGGTGQILAAAPANVANTTLSGNNVFGFNEVQNVSLGAVASTRPQAFLFDTLANGVVPQGVVSSHFIVFNPTAGRTVTGSIAFNQKVIGVQRTTTFINAARSNQLETGLTDFSGLVGASGLENGDLVTMFDGNTVNFALTGVANGSDVFRIITAVPEISTWAMMFAGFGLIGFGMRRRRVAVAA